MKSSKNKNSHSVNLYFLLILFIFFIIFFYYFFYIYDIYKNKKILVIKNIKWELKILNLRWNHIKQIIFLKYTLTFDIKINVNRRGFVM